MYQCTYCGRYLKNKYDNCPACGATDIKTVQNIGEIIIKEPPKGGYVVNLKNLKYERNSHRPYTIIRIYNSSCFFVICHPFHL